jgi:hypothetical protein
MKRLGSMSGGGMVDTMADIYNLTLGRGLYDYKGQQVVPVYEDRFLGKAMKLAAYELYQHQPIAVSVFTQARQKKASAAVAAAESILGLRPTFSEAERQHSQATQKIYSLKDKRQEQYAMLASVDDPRAMIAEYNTHVDRIAGLLPAEEAAKWRRDLTINYDSYLSNLKRRGETNPRTDRGEEQKAFAAKKYQALSQKKGFVEPEEKPKKTRSRSKLFTD